MPNFHVESMANRRRCVHWDVLGYLSGGSLDEDSVVQFKYSSADLSGKEKSIVFYLAKYVFSTFSRRLRFSKKIIKITQKYCKNIMLFLAINLLAN